MLMVKSIYNNRLIRFYFGSFECLYLLAYSSEKKNSMPTVLKNVAMKTTMSCPALAREYYEIKSQEGLVDLLREKKWQAQDVMVLGSGSNTILKSAYKNNVLSSQILGRDIIHENADAVLIRFGAGEDWHDCVDWALKQGFYGLENLALIPGLVGAAPIQNIGAYGVELADVFESLYCVDIATAEVHDCSLQDCQFGYRDSIFKGEWREKKVITSVVLRLSKQSAQHTLSSLYPALQAQFTLSDEVVTPQQVFRAVCQVRSSKLPSPDELPNSGSFFKNPIVSLSDFQKLQTKHVDIVAYETATGYKLAAGWLIEKAGLKGYSQDNGIGCYIRQALVIINPQHCSGKDVLAFANHVQSVVYEKFAVKLEIEPRVY